MPEGETNLIQKDLKKKGPISDNYRSITCLPMMCKILTAEIREETYYPFQFRWLFPEE